MNVLYSIARFIAEKEPPHTDSEGITTHSAWLPEKAELIYGTFASLLIFFLLYKLAGPAAKKAMAARTERISKELESAADDKSGAETEAAEIRQAKGDIGAERGRLIAEAMVQAESLLTDARVRLEAEVVELLARADADIATAKGRSRDELRAEIARLSASAADRGVHESIDDATQQSLIEAFIQKVGASA